ncbi:MAG: c-type cytochrome [Opitutaceae bacterium]|nr:c-type cytochrome [Opitutaceae bacterium]
MAACTAATTLFAADRHQPVDTQPAGRPLPSREAAARIHVPAGFQVTLAAAEPDVRQPIALAYDDRGRLWVAESYSYAGSTFTDERHDRILILEDADGDGVFESRKVFHDRLNRLTSLVPGFGGVWVTTAPHLAFIPDRDGDDVPDGAPVVHLDGWTLEAEHNTVNGLTWGPDGWLYGRHGIKKSSLVGRPGAATADRLEVGCAIWRYHPTRQAFEVVADGTINPWGLDFDAHGQAFMSTSVVDHLWHVVPGARFERWKDRGGHPDPYSYELMTSTSDHLHWGGGAWDKGGRLSGGNDALGGGHSHCDAMIYLGDRWPAEYRGSVFLSNIHGRRINRDALSRLPADGRYAARHQPDFITVEDPWFRAISLAYGPDGDVVMSDWSDFGECHDRDGVHRSSGRLYKISWGAPRRVAVDLARESNAALVALQRHANEFHVRHARRLLQERAHAGQDMSAVHAALQQMLREATTTTETLRALWTLHVTRGATEAGLTALLDSTDEHVRHWAVRLLTEQGPSPAIVARLVALARTEPRWLVQLALAAALQRVEVPARPPLAHALAATLPPAADPNLLRLLWYGLQPTVIRDPAASARLALGTQAPLLRRFVARRLAEAMADVPAAGDALISALGDAPSEAAQLDLLAAMNLGLKGRRQVRAPRDAARVLRQLSLSGAAPVRAPAQRLAATFGDETALAALRATMNDRQTPGDDRLAALERLAELKPNWLVDDLLALVRAGDLTEPALRALPGFADRRVVEVVLSVYPQLSPTARVAAVHALIARADSARGLLDAVAAGRIDRREISLVQARQIAQLGDAALAGQLDRVWGSVGKPSSETEGTLRRLRHELTPAVLQGADLSAGSRVYDQRCAACHTLFGRGQSIGPDLTGSGRKDLEYLLLNVVDPNAVIASDYRLSVVTLKDGQVHSGSIVKETDRAVTLRTMTAEVTVERAEIKSTQRLPMSLMPPGLFEALSATELRDLVGYLMSDGAGANAPAQP